MSRIGKKIIPVLQGIKVEIKPTMVEVEGKKGKLSVPIPPGISFELKDAALCCKRSDDSKKQRAFHGLARSLVANAVKGVNEGFTKELEIVGIGYKAQVEGKDLILNLGYSNPIRFPIPKGVEIKVDKQTQISISGINKQLVGQAAADIRTFRKPDVYKGKGIRYKGELLRKKVGKTGVGAQ
jgi:large subunit ribosomal protein L6